MKISSLKKADLQCAQKHQLTSGFKCRSVFFAHHNRKSRSGFVPQIVGVGGVDGRSSSSLGMSSVNISSSSQCAIVCAAAAVATVKSSSPPQPV